jgi:hypothetical protein
MLPCSYLGRDVGVGRMPARCHLRGSAPIGRTRRCRWLGRGAGIERSLSSGDCSDGLVNKRIVILMQLRRAGTFVISVVLAVARSDVLAALLFVIGNTRAPAVLTIRFSCSPNGYFVFATIASTMRLIFVITTFLVVVPQALTPLLLWVAPAPAPVGARVTIALALVVARALPPSIVRLALESGPPLVVILVRRPDYRVEPFTN